MGESALVESQITDAIALVRKLDDMGVPPTIAVWYYYDDADEWRLVLAGPAFDELLKKQEPAAYRRVAEAMTALSPASLTLSDVKLLNTQAALMKAVRMLIRTPANAIARAHFTNNSLNGIFIKEMFLLRAA
jgi:hypothetical protein